MRIGDLAGAHRGGTVYVVGTGPSLRCTDLAFLADKVTIGVNQAWRHLPLTYSLTVHPELLAAYEAAAAAPGFANRTRWVVKRKPPRADLRLDDPAYYVFHTRYDVACVRERPADTLYLGEGAQTAAVDLAARTGARFVVLVGCDAAALGGDFHAHDQHVRWLGVRPADQYAAYRETTAAVRAALRPLGVTVMSLSPFIGAAAADEDYARLRAELKLPALPPPADVSPYTRTDPFRRGG